MVTSGHCFQITAGRGCGGGAAPLRCFVQSPKQTTGCVFTTARGKNVKVMPALDGKRSPAHSERVGPTGPERSTGSTRSPPPGSDRPGEHSPAPALPRPPGSLDHPRASWPKCLVFHNQRGSTCVLLKRQDLCRDPCPLLGEDGPQGTMRPVSSSARPHPRGPQSAARDSDRTSVGRTHGGGGGRAALPQTVVSLLTVGTADSRRPLPTQRHGLAGRSRHPKGIAPPRGWREMHSLLPL